MTLLSNERIEVKKSWGSVKNKLKSLFVVPPTEEEEFDVSFSPPTFLRLEESVFFTDVGDSDLASDNSSIDSFPTIHRTSSQLSPPKSILKGSIPRIPSEPTLCTATPGPSVPDLAPASPVSSAGSSTISCTTPSPRRSLRRCPQTPFDTRPPTRPSPKVFRFSETVVVYETYNSDHYPRESADSPEFTPKQIEKLNREIRRYKLGEMKVHPDSINNLSLTI
ncbi:hypothetical protein L0F63_007017 [Massospora cicadina]|nr:hypothetical protein L0F63_007017 [Massospora cicadina]